MQLPPGCTVRRSRVGRGNVTSGDEVYSSSNAGSAYNFPLFWDPAMVLQVPADRDRPARIDADGPGAVSSFLHQLERRLEAVHVLSHRPYR